MKTRILKTEPLCQCPECGKEFDTHTCITDEGAVPRPGDFGLCIGCGLVFRFNVDGSLRGTTQAEFGEFKDTMPPGTMQACAAIGITPHGQRQDWSSN